MSIGSLPSCGSRYSRFSIWSANVRFVELRPFSSSSTSPTAKCCYVVGSKTLLESPTQSQKQLRAIFWTKYRFPGRTAGTTFLVARTRRFAWSLQISRRNAPSKLIAIFQNQRSATRIFIPWFASSSPSLSPPFKSFADLVTSNSGWPMPAGCSSPTTICAKTTYKMQPKTPVTVQMRMNSHGQVLPGMTGRATQMLISSHFYRIVDLVSRSDLCRHLRNSS